ncbi:MAG: GntR family transcriptional regulator [Clostridiales Family XIII bacterium]|nr:GntR family transcriptional regulator [Clostridiales Family XIII bacterium]
MPKDHRREIEIREELVFQIQNNRFNDNEKLPSEYELAEKYKVTRMTIRNVYITLREMGLICSRQGVGHFVQKKNVNIALTSKEGLGFSEKMRLRDIPCTTVNLFCRRIPYAKSIYDRLNASGDEEVFCIGRLRVLCGNPAVIHFSYLSKSKFPTIDRDGPAILSIFDYYRKLGHRNFSMFLRMLTAAFPTREEQGWLQCGSLVPLLVSDVDDFDADSSELLETSRIVARSDICSIDCSGR